MIVGQAEVLIIANDSQFERSLRAGAAPAFTGLKSDAAKAGDDAGLALAGGVGAGGRRGGEAASAGIRDGLDKGAPATEDSAKAVGDRINKGVSSGLTKLGEALSFVGLPLGNLGGKFDDVSQRAGVFGGKLGGLSLIGAVASVGILGASAASLKLGSDFQSTVATMAAQGNIPITLANQIGQAFLQSGNNVIFSAQEQATAYGQVAGQLAAVQGHVLNVAQANSFMKASMDLAEETGNSLNSTTKDLSATMQAFQIPLKNVGQTTTELFNASRITGTSIDSLTSTMDRLKARMGVAAPTVEDMSTLVVDLAEHGVTGSRALMQVNTAVNTLLNSTTANAAALAKMGIQVFDASGKFVGMGSIIAQLQPKLKGLTQQQQLQALAAVFGKSANKALLDTVLAGPAAYTKAQKSIEDQTAAHHALEVQQHTLGHEMDSIKVSVKDMATGFGLTLMPAVKDVAGAFANFFGFLLQHKPLLDALAITFGVVLAGAIGVFAVKLTQSAVDAVKQAITSLTSLFGIRDADAASTKAQTDAQDQSTMATQRGQTANEELQASIQAVTAALAEANVALTTYEENLGRILATLPEVTAETDAFAGATRAAGMAAVTTGDEMMVEGEMAQGAGTRMAAAGAEADLAGGQVLGMGGKARSTAGEAENLGAKAAGAASAEATVGADAAGAVGGLSSMASGIGPLLGQLGLLAGAGAAAYGAMTWLLNNTPIGKGVAAAAEGVANFLGVGDQQVAQQHFQSGLTSGGGNSDITFLIGVANGTYSTGDPSRGPAWAKDILHGYGVPGYDEGGWVPGVGPRLSFLHGGEYVMSREMLAGRDRSWLDALRPAVAATGAPTSATGAAPGGTANAVNNHVEQHFYMPMSPSAVADEVGWALRVAPCR